MANWSKLRVCPRQHSYLRFEVSAAPWVELQRPALATCLNPGNFPGFGGDQHTTKPWENFRNSCCKSGLEWYRDTTVNSAGKSDNPTCYNKCGYLGETPTPGLYFDHCGHLEDRVVRCLWHRKSEGKDVLKLCGLEEKPKCEGEAVQGGSTRMSCK